MIIMIKRKKEKRMVKNKIKKLKNNREGDKGHEKEKTRASSRSTEETGEERT